MTDTEQGIFLTISSLLVASAVFSMGFYIGRNEIRDCILDDRIYLDYCIHGSGDNKHNQM